VLERVRGNRLEASRILKVSYKTMLNKITEYGLTRRNGQSGSAAAEASSGSSSGGAAARPDARARRDAK